MAWWVKKDVSYLGPGFDWVDEAKERTWPIYSLGLSVSYRLSPDNVPRVARARGKCKGAPRQGIFLVECAVVCRPKLKELVEQVEPGVHLFVPIELQYEDGSPMEGEFYYFNCQVDIDCVLTDNKEEWFRSGRVDGRITPSFSLIQKLTPLDIRLSKPQIAGHHLWTGGVHGHNQLFISDEFYEICRKARFKAWEYWRHCEEVDREWVAEEHMGPLLDLWRECEAKGDHSPIRWI